MLRRKPLSRSGKSEGSISKGILDRIFSIFIRMRDVYNEYGQVKCLTCTRVYHWTAMDNGHFVGRGAQSTRWNEENCNSQCRLCNTNNDLVKHAEAIDIKYGPGTAGRLTILSKSSLKITEYEMRSLIQFYAVKVRALTAEKNLVADLSFLEK